MTRLEALAGAIVAATLLAAPDGHYHGGDDGDVYPSAKATRRIVDTIIFNLLR